MHEVFISYSTKDTRQTETVRDVLERNQIKCWMAPRDIPAGSDYYSEIPVAIKASKVFLLIVSRNALDSKYVIKELRTAVESGCVTIPFMIENIQLNNEFDFLLSGAQRHEAYRKKAEALENLIIRIRAITHPGVASAQIYETEPIQIPTVSAAPSYGEGQCPACGSYNVQQMLGKTGKHGILEYLSLLIPLVAGMLGGFVTLILAVIVTSILGFDNMTGLHLLLTLAGIVLFWIWGGKWGNEWIRRSRVRRHMSEHPYICEDCKKEFLVKREK